MADVAVFCNSYPNIDVSFQVEDPDVIAAGDVVEVVVKLEREIDEDEMESDDIEQLGCVSCPLYPKEKKEGWWVVIGDTSTNTLYSLKRVNLQQVQSVKLEFMAPDEAGEYNLTLFCMSDSYLGSDQEYEIPLNVAIADSDDDDDSDDSEEED